ncbi:MAG: kynureninase [Cyanobacteria bacterium SZAS TMP-1]|nr:kynureninase [Cyanobacteria bacterium SZAS TMP-1]
MIKKETTTVDCPVPFEAGVDTSLECARNLDQTDALKHFRELFYLPAKLDGERSKCVYLTGNSLGLQPKKAREYIEAELTDWQDLGVEGHFHARHAWMPYHEFVTDMSARLVGAKPIEVVVMNTLTVNLHLMMVSFYRPTKTRYKILVEKGAFPSDQYAVASQAAFHGFDPGDAVVELCPEPGADTLETEKIIETIAGMGDQLALVLLGNVNYLTGQAFESEKIARAAHEAGAFFGLNLAHGAGNLLLQLHDWQVDFAVWCSYKYLNAGPGGIAGCFVHEKHAHSFDIPRFAGWWGHDKKTRFQMGPEFSPIPGAEGWQLSNPPIFQLAALRASLEIFDHVTMPALRAKACRLTAYMQYLLDDINTRVPGFCRIITPRDPAQRGSQLSLKFTGESKKLLEQFKAEGVVCDFREPDIIRATAVPLYNSFEDVHRFCQVVKKFAQAEEN